MALGHCGGPGGNLATMEWMGIITWKRHFFRVASFFLAERPIKNKRQTTLRLTINQWAGKATVHLKNQVRRPFEACVSAC